MRNPDQPYVCIFAVMSFAPGEKSPFYAGVSYDPVETLAALQRDSEDDPERREGDCVIVLVSAVQVESLELAEAACDNFRIKVDLDPKDFPPDGDVSHLGRPLLKAVAARMRTSVHYSTRWLDFLKARLSPDAKPGRGPDIHIDL